MEEGEEENTAGAVEKEAEGRRPDSGWDSRRRRPELELGRMLRDGRKENVSEAKFLKLKTAVVAS